MLTDSLQAISETLYVAHKARAWGYSLALTIIVAGYTKRRWADPRSLEATFINLEREFAAERAEKEFFDD